MSVVEDRIVNMQFNNKQFVSGATESKSALESVERALTNAGNAKGLDQMGHGVQAVRAKFGALQVIAVTALATIASKAIDTGLTFLKSFTGINSVMDGFHEYETKIGATQTIIANTGESLQTVNKYLGQLNTYSDKTIYNFGDMTKNIGLFTNAGIKIKAATNMIMGFSNEAAVSGTTSAQAAGAAYQLSQALNTGIIRLMDWKSLQNVGMGNKNMQEGLLTLATSMGSFEGTTINAQIAQENFNGSLEKNWLTADVMQAYLEIKAGKLTDAQMKNLNLTDAQIKQFKEQAKVAQNAATKVRTWTQLVGTIRESIGSGWSKSIELILGDFHDATKLFTNINDSVGGVLKNMAKSRNDMLKEWADKGGRDAMINGLGRVATSLGSVFKTVGKAFRDVFPPSSENLLLNLSKGFNHFTKTLVPSKSTLQDLRSIFGGLFSVLKIGLGVVGGLAGGVGKLFGVMFSGSKKASPGLLSILASVGDAVTVFQEWLTSVVNIQKVLSGFGSVAASTFKPVATVIGMVSDAILALAAGEGLDGVKASFEGIRTIALTFVNNLLGGLAKIASPFAELSNYISNIRKELDGWINSFSGFDKISGSTSSVVSAFGNMHGVMDSASAGLSKVGAAGDRVKSSMSSLFDSFKGSDTVTYATDQMAASANTAGERWSRVKSILSTLGNVLKSVFTHIGDIFGWLAGQFSDLFGGLDAVEWASLTNALFTGAFILSIKSFADTIGTVATTFEDIRKSIVNSFGALTDTLKTMQSAIKAEMIKDIAIAVALLTVSLIALTFLDPKKVAIAIGFLATMMGMLVGSLAGLGKVSSEMNMAVIAASILLISAAMINLAIAVTILGHQDLGTLAKGLGAMAIALGLMVVAMNQMSGIAGRLGPAGVAILLIAVAMNVLAGAIAIFGNMDMGTLAKGLGAMAIGLGLMTGALIILSLLGKNMVAAAGAIMIVALAMTAMAGVVGVLGNMDMGTLAKGLGAVAIGMALMVAALLILAPQAPMVIIVAEAMAIMAAAMVALAIAVGAFGSMDMGTLAKGFGAVAVGLTLLLIAAAVAMNVAPGLVILSASIALLGAAMLMAGVGMLAFGTGFALMASVGAAGVAVIVLAIKAFIALLPSLAMQITAAFVAVLQVLAAASPKIRKSMDIIVKNMLGIIRDNIPEFGKLLIQLIDTGVTVVKQSAPKMIDAAFTIMDAFLQEVADRTPEMTKKGIAIIQAFIQAVAEQSKDLTESAADALIKFIHSIADTIDDKAGDIRDAGWDIAVAIINGMTGGLLDWGISKIESAVTELVSHIPGPIKKMLGIDSPSKVTYEMGKWVAKGMANGILAGIKDVVAAAVAMANAIISEGDKIVRKVQREASKKQQKANRSDATADITEKRAKAARKAADKFARKNPKAKEQIKKNEKQAKKLERLAAKQRKQADDAQKKADNAAQHVADVQAFRAADNVGKGDIRQDQAVELSDRASKMLAKANAEAAEARRLMKVNKKAGQAMLVQAQKDAKEAGKLAEKARTANEQANKYYEKEVAARIKQLEDDATYDAATTSGKIAILEERALANEAKAKAARDAAQALIDKAKAIAEKDAAAALRLTKKAEKAAQEAKDAADAAQQERDAIDQLRNPSGGSGGYIQPSSSVLEDAASVVDRYTLSLQQAELLAGGDQPPIQFIQNNTSPESLSPTQLYRNGKNLLSLAEIKMGVKPPYTPEGR